MYYQQFNTAICANCEHIHQVIVWFTSKVTILAFKVLNTTKPLLILASEHILTYIANALLDSIEAGTPTVL